MPSPSSFQGKLKAIIEDYEKKRIRWYRLLGADCPLTGHRNRSLQEILAEVVKQGWDYYPTETDCLYDFKEAATVFERRSHNVDYSPEDIVAVSGVASAWQLLHNVILESGDEIVVIEPAHYLTGPVLSAYYSGAKVIQVPMVEEEQWTLDLDMLRTALNDKTKAIVIDHPNNPTGHIYGEKERKALVDIAGEYDIPIISDELYCEITYDYNMSPSMAAVSGDVPVVVLTSFSKLFMVPGWRIGYVAFHDPRGRIKEVKRACTRLAETYGHVSTGIPLPILVAATRVLCMTRVRREIAWAQEIKSPMDESMEMLEKLQERRDYTYKRLCEIDGINVVNAQASLYMFPRVEMIGKVWKTNEDFLLELLNEERVAFSNGNDYGNHGFGHFRTLFLNDTSVLEEVYNRLDRYIRRHTREA